MTAGSTGTAICNAIGDWSRGPLLAVRESVVLVLVPVPDVAGSGRDGWGIGGVVPTFVGNLSTLTTVARPLTIALLVGAARRPRRQ